VYPRQPTRGHDVAGRCRSPIFESPERVSNLGQRHTSGTSRIVSKVHGEGIELRASVRGIIHVRLESYLQLAM
jgi:hypothetical protein